MDATPSPSGQMAPTMRSCSADPSLKLPPLIRHHSLPDPSPSAVYRSMHQLQLEMEYDAQESDDQNQPATHRHGPKAHATSCQDGTLDVAAPEIHALCIFDNVTALSIPSSESRLVEALSGAVPKRKWGRWKWRGPPVLSDIRVRESIYLYERGVELGAERRCSSCQAGKGVSPQCVVVPGHLSLQDDSFCCSNCIYDGRTDTCNVSPRDMVSSSRAKSRSTPLGDPDQVVDHLAVLDMIARLKRPLGSCRDQSLPERARRIEHAALHIAQAAREWGEKMAK